MVASEEEAQARRSRLYRIEAQVAELEGSPNATRAAELAPVITNLLRRESLGPAFRERVGQLESRVAAAAARPVETKGKKKKARFEVGELVRGECVSVRPFGAMIALEGRAKPALLHISEISAGRVASIERVIPVGSRVVAVVVGIDEVGRVSLSTSRLEPTPGAMLRDPEAVYADAENNLPVIVAPRAEPDVEAIAESAAKLGDRMSLDAIDELIARSLNTKTKQAPPTVDAEETTSAAPSQRDALSLASAFQPNAPSEVSQRQQEFELLMRDVVYEPPSALTDVSKLIRGRGKRGAFTSPFWAKIFKRDALPKQDDADDDGTSIEDSSSSA
ncbi:hypothetical protein CTAYLR_002272 [Chrysophaeum taylorii]|uniref:S1 motif domain-containing protein n=1 Tax=Chrysophaeum taylorii TaxID=2483200 RepID=A0AAD7XQ66_9STRA|nr:hypothetical protein CTAYLR_002272 [Chrysophaeum taylorii]